VLRIGFAAAESDAIVEAAEGCPVEVIRFVEGPGNADG
jgi:hypothetical protein